MTLPQLVAQLPRDPGKLLGVSDLVMARNKFFGARKILSFLTIPPTLYILNILDKFGYKVVCSSEGMSNVWTLQRTPSSVTSAMKHLVVVSSSDTSRALLWGTVPPELRDVYKKAGCKETKHDAITVMDLLSKYGFRVLSQSQRPDGLMSWTLGKQM